MDTRNTKKQLGEISNEEKAILVLEGFCPECLAPPRQKHFHGCSILTQQLIQYHESMNMLTTGSMSLKKFNVAKKR